MASFQGSEAQLDVPIRHRYEFYQRGFVYLLTPPQLHMPHSSAGAFQDAGPIVEKRTIEEPDIRVCAKGADVGERRISNTRSRVVVVQDFANVCSAASH